ncbi:cobalt-precorrin-5B (C(1))-methyltransferase [Suicoccus acidiformans]|uniref:Cobalt-precorrin-5B C(1)-methyltransferase n=1 Tax=Suicoccus acidiformans TaxID=2036206 RepID=A0A347WM19_9LACT|nr:cobalt-precorrin-5B (C(1))-methyltransferase CbiD [Suicoccus acidiformans]AXY26126.1 cobalt-precorrin-5B (C(1))-methyltransferase [Suicoccus acidiformans]
MSSKEEKIGQLEFDDQYVSYNGKRLRKGYTTGTCATAATMAALEMIQTQERVERVNLTTPSGVNLDVEIHNQEFDNHTATCSVIKDGGDDQDATHGLDIFSKVTLRTDGEIVIDGGTGVGRVTQKGLQIEPGHAAINPTPRRMLREVAEKLLEEGQGCDILISVPKGEETAKATFNPRLGIVGGISILGTSGIVTPMSEESWKHSITGEMQIKFNQGHDRIILTPGNYGEDYIKEHTQLNPIYVVQMSNFVGYVLLEAMRIGFRKILLVGHFGKFIKLAGGIFSTHSKDADGRNEIMVANLALLGAPLDLLEQVNNTLTTESQAEIILEAGYGQVYDVLVEKIKQRSLAKLKYRDPDIEIEAIAFLKDQPVFATTKSLVKLEKEYSL